MCTNHCLTGVEGGEGFYCEEERKYLKESRAESKGSRLDMAKAREVGENRGDSERWGIVRRAKEQERQQE